MKDILYKKSRYGIKEWKINVVDHISFSTIEIETGFIDCKKTSFIINITRGKNIGKINQTSHFQQAINIANSKWNTKIKDGYTIKKDLDKHHLVYPMLAQDFNKHSNKIIFPCYVQRKFDGIRAIYENGKLHSRKLLLFPHLSHITLELNKIDKNIILDGELYSNTLSFQELSGLVRKEKLSNSDVSMINKIHFRVYDIVNNNNYIDRYNQLSTLFNKTYNTLLNTRLTESFICNTKNDIIKYHSLFVKEMYEGAIIRNYLGKYEQDTRSYNLQKYKSFDDSEFTITDFKDGVGSDTGAVIWTCITQHGKYFDVRPIGSISDRRKIYKNGKKYIGEKLNVKYFGLTDDGIPRFPIGMYIRDTNY